MYIPERNFYISEKNNILFDLNEYRIFYITNQMCSYLLGEDDIKESLSEDEWTVINTILSSNESSGQESTAYDAVKIHVSNTCNLRCKYCYAHGGDYGQAKALMDIETARKVVRFINNEKELENIRYITFFGGEPLLNPGIIEYICEHTSDRNVGYLLQTNGTLMDSNILRIIKKYDITLTISLDGPQTVNDFNRVDTMGRGTYEKILNNIKFLKENGVTPKAIEATLSGEFIEDYSKENIADYIYEQTGVKLIKVEYDENLGMKENEQEIRRGVRKFFERCLDGKYIMDNEAYRLLQVFFAKQYYDYICPAGNSVLTIDVTGNVFPCQLFIENDKWKMGNIENGFSIKKLSCYQKSRRTECQKCPARRTCSMCIAKGIDLLNCNKNILLQSEVLECLAECVCKGDFEKLYTNFLSL